MDKPKIINVDTVFFFFLASNKSFLESDKPIDKSDVAKASVPKPHGVLLQLIL